MEVHKYDKWGPVLRVDFLPDEDVTEIICYSDPREYFGRSLQKSDELQLMRLTLEGCHEGLVFVGNQVLHEKGLITVSLVKKCKLVKKEKSVVLRADNAFDRALIEMGAFDVLMREKIDE